MTGDEAVERELRHAYDRGMRAIDELADTNVRVTATLDIIYPGYRKLTLIVSEEFREAAAILRKNAPVVE